MEADRCRDLRPLLPSYAVGSGPSDTNLRVQLHLSEGCPKCAAEIEWLMEAFHAVPLGLTPAPVGPELRARVVAEAGALPQESRETPILFPETDAPRLWKVLTTLAAVAVAVMAVWGRGLMEDRDALRARAEAAPVAGPSAAGDPPGVDSAALERQADQLAAILQSISDPRSLVLDLKGPVPARAFLDPEDGAMTISAEGLGTAGWEGLLHVWLLGGEAPVLLSALPPEYARDGGQIRLRLPTLPAAPTVLVTREPGATSTPGDVVVWRSE